MSLHGHITEISDPTVYLGDLVSMREKNPLLWHASELLFVGGTMTDGASGVYLGL